jgi:hypothetical protein
MHLQSCSNVKIYNKSSVADPGCLSRIRIFPSRIQSQKDSGSASKNLSILTHKIVVQALATMIQDVIFYQFRIPDLGVKKAPDPGSGSATYPKYGEITVRFYHRGPIFSTTQIRIPDPGIVFLPIRIRIRNTE